MELVVDEPIAGHFYWLVLDGEVFGQPRAVIEHSPGPYPTHRQATDAGVAAVLRHSEPVEYHMAAGSQAVKAQDDSGRASVR
jgi:hypothetical protein